MPPLADTLDSVPTWVPGAGPAARAGETVSNIYDQVSSGERLDIPTATGEGEWFDTLYDTAVEQPEWAEDDEDLLGPSVGEVTDGIGLTDGLDPTDGDDSGVSGQSGARILVVVLVVGAALWLLRPLLTIGAEVVAE
jgi:hypothetical protein